MQVQGWGRDLKLFYVDWCESPPLLDIRPPPMLRLTRSTSGCLSVLELPLRRPSLAFPGCAAFPNAETGLPLRALLTLRCCYT